MKDAKNATQEAMIDAGVSRRRFLGYAAGITGAGLLIGSCKKEEDSVIPEPGSLDLGTNDTGLVNLMFVTQQVEAAFYIQIVETPYSGMNGHERLLFLEMRDQEIAHREFLRNYLKGAGTVVDVDLGIVDFNSRERVLENLEMVENLVVSSFNEIGRLLTFGDNTAVLVKMVSVEARHAATVANMRKIGAYFNTVDVIGAEQGTLPSNTVTTINRFLATKVSGNNLPNK